MRRKEPIRHGTIGGYQAHIRHKVEPCRECLDAHRNYYRSYRRGRGSSTN